MPKTKHTPSKGSAKQKKNALAAWHSVKLKNKCHI